MNPKHEAKQKLNGAKVRFNRAVEAHVDGHLIRKTVQGAIAEGADPVQAFEVGIQMCREHSGRVTVSGDEGPVTIKWGWFASESDDRTTPG